jgi:hypothetical protein
MASFSAQVQDAFDGMKGALEVILKESAQELAETAQTTVNAGGNLPIDTGFLRASLMASTASAPSIDPNAKPPKDAGPGSIPLNTGQIEAVIAGLELGEPLYLAWTAAYARRLEYGFTGGDSLGRYYSTRGYGFTRLAAQQWPQIVDRVARRLSAKIAFSTLS